MHGRSQNQNESFNGLIWERLPKTTYVSLTQLRFLGAFDAVAHFNIGEKSYVLIIEELGMIPGCYMTKQCELLNRKRLFHFNYKLSERVCKKPKVLCGQKKSSMDCRHE